MGIIDGQLGANGYPEWEKDPDNAKNIVIDWSAWLTKRGLVSIATSTWIAPTGIAIASQSNTSTQASVFLSGGTRGRRYQVVNRITATGGHSQDQTIEVVIRPE